MTKVPTVALINPNSSAATTATLVAIARRALGEDYRVHGRTARTGPTLIQDEAALRDAAREVLAIARRLLADHPAPDALIVAAFGDPAVDALRDSTSVPVVGIAEAAIGEAADGGRRFGIATTTPGLVDVITAKVTALGAATGFTGIRLTSAHPDRVMADPDLLYDQLAAAVRDCVRLDHADAVVIGGGPLAAVADRLHSAVPVPLIAPVPAACRAVARLLAARF